MADGSRRFCCWPSQTIFKYPQRFKLTLYEWHRWSPKGPKWTRLEMLRLVKALLAPCLLMPSSLVHWPGFPVRWKVEIRLSEHLCRAWCFASNLRELGPAVLSRVQLQVATVRPAIKCVSTSQPCQPGPLPYGVPSHRGPYLRLQDLPSHFPISHRVILVPWLPGGPLIAVQQRHGRGRGSL